MSNNIIFSFDIGNTSIGWSVADINVDNDKLNLNLLLTGVRLFNEASVGAQNKNINLARRTSRLARKRGARKSKRKLIVKSLLQNKLKWFTKNNLDHNNKDNIFNQLISQAEHNNCYLIRVKGLTQKLSKVEIACALFHMAKYRGYIDSSLVSTSTTQDANVKKEEATIKNAIEQLNLKYGHLNCHVERVVQSVKDSTQIIEQEKSKLNKQESNNYICAGRACYHNKQIVSKDSKGNYVKKPNYQHTIENKNIVEVEIPTFFATQSQYYPELTTEIQQQFINIVKWKAEPKSFNIGNCPLIEGEKVTSVHSISFLKFKLLSLLLNVRIMQNDEEYSLNKTEIINIFNEIINDTKLEIKYNHLEKFIKEHTNYNNFTFKGIANDVKLSSKKFISFASIINLKNICPTITDNEIDIIYNIALKDSNNIKNIFNNIQNNQQLSATVKQDIKLKQNDFNKLAFSGTVAYCSTAYNKIFNAIWQEINNTSTALPNKFSIQSFIDKLYPKVEQKAENNFLPDIFNPNITQPFRYFLPTNPSIIRVINEFRKLYNELVNRFGTPNEVKLELLRELKNPKAKDNYIKIRNQNEQANIEAKAQHGDALKGRLYNEQGGKCLYCNTQLNGGPSFSNTQLDHILPYSVTFDDSFNNKTLCCTACNQNKGKNTPYMWLSQNNKWEDFKTTINNTSTLKNNKKINNYLTTKESDDLIEGFSNRSLNDSSYASKLIKDYIAQYSNVTKITPSTGMLTSFWRKLFGLKKYRDITDCATHLQNTVFNFIVKDINAPQEIKNILQNTKTLATDLYNAKKNKLDEEKKLKDDTKVFTEAEKKEQKNKIDELDKQIKALTINHQQYKVEFTKYIIQNDTQGSIFSLLQYELNEFKVNNYGKADDDTNIIFSNVETQNSINDYARSLLNNTKFTNKIAIILINWVGNMHHAVDACLIALNNNKIIKAIATEFGKINLDEETKKYKDYIDKLVYTLGNKIITDENSYNALKNYKQQIISQVIPQALLTKQKYKTVKLLKSNNNNAYQIGILAKPNEKNTINTLKTVSKKVNQSISGGLHKETIHTKKEIKNNKDKDESTIYVVNNGLASADKVVRTDLYKLTKLLKNDDKNSKIDTKQVLRAIKLADIYLPINRSHGKNKGIILPEYNNLSYTNTWLLNGKLNQNDLAITSNNANIINTLYAYYTAGKLTLNALQTYYQNNDIVGLAMHCNFIANTHTPEITNLKATINNKAKYTKLLKESQSNTATPSVINTYATLFTDLHALTLSTANFMFSLQSYNIVSYTANAKTYYIEYRSYRMDNQLDYRNIKFNSGQAYLALNTLSNLKKHTVDLLGFVSRGITKENLDINIFNKQTALVNSTLQQNIANIINQGGKMAGFKPILINNPSYLCIQYNNLQVQNTATNTKVAIPLTDIATVVLNHNAISLPASVLSAFAEHNIALLTLNSKYMPISITTPLNTYYKASAVAHAQLQVSNSLLGNLWQHIIKNKITNQATCLNKLNLQGNTILKLASTVKLADKDNTEAIAARLYFTQLFNKNFNREENTLNNAMLNFGYAIVRSNIAKFIVGYGLNPMLGVKHCSMLNNFNLADDLIEPFRALIDYNVKQYIINNNITNNCISLTTEHKKYLLNLLFFNINTPLGNTTLLNAIEQYVLSFVKSILQKQNLLININFITE